MRHFGYDDDLHSPDYRPSRGKTAANLDNLDLDELIEEAIERKLRQRLSTISQESNASDAKTWSQWQELKKSNPSKYNEPKTQQKMLEDYRELGTDFEDGDFRKYGDSLNAR